MSIRLFLLSAASIFCGSAFLKAISVLAPIPYFDLKDPLFHFLSNRQLMVIAVILEALAGGIILFSANAVLKLYAVAGLTSLFIGYRVGLWWIGSSEPCACLGRAGDWLNLSGETVDLLMKGVLLYLVIFSSRFLYFQRKNSFGMAPNSESMVQQIKPGHP